LSNSINLEEFAAKSDNKFVKNEEKSYVSVDLEDFDANYQI